MFTLQFVGAAAYRSHKTERGHNRAGRLALPNLSGLRYFIYIFINCLSVPALQPFKHGPGGLSNVDSKIAGQGEHRKLGLIALIVAESQLITGRVLPRGTAAQTETKKNNGLGFERLLTEGGGGGEEGGGGVVKFAPQSDHFLTLFYSHHNWLVPEIRLRQRRGKIKERKKERF